MSVPIFFSKNIENGFARLDEEESRHCLSVLRKRAGDECWVVDGRGHFFTGELAEGGKKSALVRLVSEKKDWKKRPLHLHLAVAPTKNLDRFEWFLEKAVEIGLEEITPIRCRRSERETIRLDRLEKVMVAAMKQSLRASLPKMSELTDFQSFVKKTETAQKFIAHCQTDGLPLLKTSLKPGLDCLILIGPEGDFSIDEIEFAVKYGFQEISLGDARLRTETAAIVACHTVSLIND